MPKISIITPHYNHTRALKRCLNRIAKQTFRDFEIIVVDDGSELEEQRALRQLLEEHRLTDKFDIKAIFTEHGGASCARNHGVSVARGTYLLFCDADIVMKPNMLTRMAGVLDNNPDAAFVYASFRYGWKVFRLHSFDKEILKDNNYIHTTSLLRREWFPGFDEALSRFQDWDLWLTITERGGEGIWVPEILFTVLPHRHGISAWLPAFMYKIPWEQFGIRMKRIEAYNHARKIIQEKHAK